MTSKAEQHERARKIGERLGEMDEQAKYTPGPWKINDHSKDEGEECFYIESECDGIATVFTDRNAKANALLIASAPDMHQALQGLADALKTSLSWLSSYSGGGAMGCYDQARAALKAAKPFLEKK